MLLRDFSSTLSPSVSLWLYLTRRIKSRVVAFFLAIQGLAHDSPVVYDFSSAKLRAQNSPYIDLLRQDRSARKARIAKGQIVTLTKRHLWIIVIDVIIYHHRRLANNFDPNEISPRVFVAANEVNKKKARWKVSGPSCWSKRKKILAKWRESFRRLMNTTNHPYTTYTNIFSCFFFIRTTVVYFAKVPSSILTLLLLRTSFRCNKKIG